MTPGAPPGRAGELRRAFDDSFARANREAGLPAEAFLAIRSGDQPYALRLDEVAGLFVDQKVTPVPSRVTDLLGIASLRGVVLPVYDLRKLLGQANAAPARWLAVAAGLPVAVAFDAVEGHLRLERAAVVPVQAGQSSWKHVLDVVRTIDGARPIVHLPSILGLIRQHKER